jgi:hypothetical protein
VNADGFLFRNKFQAIFHRLKPRVAADSDFMGDRKTILGAQFLPQQGIADGQYQHNAQAVIETVKCLDGMHQHRLGSDRAKLFGQITPGTKSFPPGDDNDAVFLFRYHCYEISSSIFCNSLSVLVNFSLQKVINSDARLTLSVKASTSKSPDSMALTIPSSSFFAWVYVCFSIYFQLSTIRN